MSLQSYSKPLAYGHRYLEDLHSHFCWIQEKIDGSQFSFGVVNGTLRCRSRRVEIDPCDPPNLFAPATLTARKLHSVGRLPEGWTFRGEAVCKPKHNSLTYGRAPAGGFILFDIDRGRQDYFLPEFLPEVAKQLGLEAVPVLDFLHPGERLTDERIAELLATESVLGGQVEGFVIKNYYLLGSDAKVVMAKVVSESFKEIHAKNPDWRPNGKKDVVDEVIESLALEASWQKAVAHLAEEDRLDHSPRDIGPLIKEAQADIMSEAREHICSMLFARFAKDIRRKTTAGLADWYKRRLRAEVVS